MANTQETPALSVAEKGRYRLLFIASTIITVALFWFAPEWSWLAFPFFFTYFVKMYDWI